MENIVQGVGRLKGKTFVEDLAKYNWDTIILKAAGNGKATLKPVKLFVAAQNSRDNRLQNFTVPVGKGQTFAIKYMRITHNLRFTTDQQKWIFEQFSYLKFNIEDVNYSPIPFSHLLTYNRVKDNGKTSIYTALDVLDGYNVSIDEARAKDGGFVKIPTPIILPELGRAEVEFVPGGDGIETTAVATDGVKWGAGVVDEADSSAFFIRIELLGTELRERTK